MFHHVFGTCKGIFLLELGACICGIWVGIGLINQIILLKFHIYVVVLYFGA
jgi:hypothetical protein